MKVRNAVSETFNSYVGKEVYVIGGEMKGYRATLYDVRNDSCKVAVHGQRPITLNPCDVATR
jgi:ribosomal protein L24